MLDRISRKVPKTVVNRRETEGQAKRVKDCLAAVWKISGLRIRVARTQRALRNNRSAVLPAESLIAAIVSGNIDTCPRITRARLEFRGSSRLTRPFGHDSDIKPCNCAADGAAEDRGEGKNSGWWKKGGWRWCFVGHRDSPVVSTFFPSHGATSSGRETRRWRSR